MADKNQHDRRWRVELSGAKLDLDSLRREIHDADIEFSIEGDRCFLTASRMEAARDAMEADSLARDLVAELNAAARLEWRNAEPVEVARIYERGKKPGVWMQHAILAAAKGRSLFHAVGAVVVAGEESDTPDPPSRVQQIVERADADDDVQELLHHLGGELTWYELYKAYEIVKKSGRGNRLTKTAQTKRHSRHYRARRGHQPPASPMSLDEARDYVRELAIEWLENRVPRQRPG